ncbi:MFS transporter [Phenylobacterium sp. LjRoot225]|uniref:MFS transporter n=1 Tax=Phenylobacterium sp. LjRoot225 TaxID=3342285 RepID=UPI003ECF8F60
MAQIDLQRPAAQPASSAPPPVEPVQRYAYLALAVLTASSFLNFLDRQILSILAQGIKADLGLTDAQLGFLLGTAFAVFYAVVGIAMGRISDAVDRTRLMGAGLAVWSAMTVLGAAATSFGGLAAARIGVGIGESTANPCSHSLLSQYFPARRRAAAIGTYLAGAFLGSAAALLTGGLLLQHWGELCRSVPFGNACTVPSWKATLVIVGLPGLPLALLVASLREPPRPPRPPSPLHRLVVREFGAAVPPFTLFTLYALGGLRALCANLVLIAVIVGAATALVQLTGDLAQWAAIALGAYSICTWGQVLKLRDLPLFRLTFGCPTFTLAMASGALIACVIGTVQAWAAPYAMRVLGMSPGSAGVSLGLIFAVGAGAAVILGGWLTDTWKRRDARAPIWVALLGLLAATPAMIAMLTAQTSTVYLVAYAAFCLVGSAWSGAFGALVQDLVLPRMRGAAASAFALVSVVIASGAGPYWAGKVSTLTGSLATGMLSIQALSPIAIIVLLLTARRLKGETEAGRRTRAEAAGEAPLVAFAPV